MDGSNAAFLLDEAFASTRERGPRGGILYVEDFDSETPKRHDQAQDSLPPPEPSYGQAELDAARQAGREEGAQLALADAQLLQAQLQSEALQSLTEGLIATRATLQAVAEAHAMQTAHALLAVLQAALPAAMRAHAGVELQAVVRALAPGLVCEPELRVRAHPDRADAVREQLIAVLPDETCVLAVCGDATLAEGDLLVAWKNGRARRDTAAIWAQIRAALAPLGLPTLEELCRGC